MKDGWATDAEIYRTAARLQTICRSKEINFIVESRLGAAANVLADGYQLAEQAAEAVRRNTEALARRLAAHGQLSPACCILVAGSRLPDSRANRRGPRGTSRGNRGEHRGRGAQGLSAGGRLRSAQALKQGGGRGYYISLITYQYSDK
eukprot:6146749-Pyramimonas_sp.AAC.1